MCCYVDSKETNSLRTMNNERRSRQRQLTIRIRVHMLFFGCFEDTSAHMGKTSPLAQVGLERDEYLFRVTENDVCRRGGGEDKSQHVGGT